MEPALPELRFAFRVNFSLAPRVRESRSKDTLSGAGHTVRVWELVLPLKVRTVIFTVPGAAAAMELPLIAAMAGSELSSVQEPPRPLGRVTLTFEVSPTPSSARASFRETDFGARLISS